MIASLAELDTYLSQVQAQRRDEVRCELTAVLSARVSDAVLRERLLLGLPMAQGLQPRILRSRGRGAVLTVKIRYRQGVRMLADDSLTGEESAVLEAARKIVADLLPLGEAERFRVVYDWLCRHVRYVHTAPGRKGYERLVCATGALLDGQANCQGFADALYLLCGLCGVGCEYRIGRGERRLHVWNTVCLNGAWQEADASRGARAIGD